MRRSMLIAAIYLVLFSLLFFSCTSLETNYRYTQAQALGKYKFSKVVIVPLDPINNVDQADFLSGENQFSNSVGQLFKNGTTVISAQKVRKDLHIQTTAFVDLASLSTYDADCFVECKLSNLNAVSYETGSGISGTFEADVELKFIDPSGTLLTSVSGDVTCTSFWVWAPSFNDLVSTVMQDMIQKLNSRSNEQIF